MNHLRHLLIPLIAIFLATASFAQGTNVAFGTISQDTSLPVEINADALSVDQESGTAVFTGNVKIGQGEMRLTAGRVLVVYRDQNSGIERLEATGGVTLVSGADAAESRRADYNIDTGTIVMTGDVLLTQGPSALTADRMSVRLSDGTAEMSGSVRTILQPGGNGR